MAVYKSNPVEVSRPAKEIFDRFTDMTALEQSLGDLPQEQRAQIGDVKFTPDSIEINTPQVGAIRFEVTQRVEPTRIVFGTPSSPVPLTMEVDINPLTADSSMVQTLIDVEIPAMLRPIIGPKLQQAANKFGELIKTLAR